MIVFGGAGGAEVQDTWSAEFSGGTASWSQLSPIGSLPSRRQLVASAWDAAQRQLIVFGGQNDSGSLLDDTWALSLAGAVPTWTRLFPGGANPSARSAMASVWDPVSRRMIIFGGETSTGRTNTVWQLSFASGTPTWSQVSTSGTPPTPRWQYTGSWDPVGQRLILFGGNTGSFSAETWVLSFASPTPQWSRLFPAVSPTGRDAYASFWDATNQQMIIFGGRTSSARVNDTWALSLAGPTPSWTNITPTGTNPIGRGWHSLVWDESSRSAFLFGGFDSSSARNDIWRLSLDGAPTWELCPAPLCSSTPPQVTLQQPANATSLAQCAPTLTWSDPAPGGHSYSVILNGATIVEDLSTPSYTIPTGTALQPTGNAWQVRTVGCPGNFADSASFTFDVQTSPGTPTLVAPANGATEYCSASFSWNAPPGNETYTYDLLVGTAPPLDPLVADLAATSVTLQGDQRLPNGTYVWQVRATDCTGNASLSSLRSFTVENTPPAPVQTTPLQGEFTDTNPRFDWTIANARPDVRYDLRIDGSVFQPSLAATEYVVTSSRALSGGPHTWSVDAVGCLDVTANSGTRGFTVDVDPPAPFDLITPAAGAWFADGPISFEWAAATDDGAGVAGYEHHFDGAFRANVAGTSVAWNPNSSVTFDFDDSAQLVEWQLEGTWGLGAASGRTVLSDSPQGNYQINTNFSATLSTPIPLTTGASMSYWLAYDVENSYDRFFVEVRPTGGNWTSVASYTGSSAGAMRTVSLASFVGQTVQVRFRLDSDNIITSDGVSIDDLVINGAATGVAEGVHNWHAVAIDAVGNRRDSTSTRDIGIDRTPPGIAATYPAETITNNQLPTITWTAATDTLSGIGAYDVSVSGVTVATVPSPSVSWSATSSIAEGTHSLRVNAFDRANNLRLGDLASLIVDLTPPNATPLVSPQSGSFVPFLTPDLCWSAPFDGGSGVSHYELFVDGAKTGGDVPANTSPLCTTGFGLDGVHSWFVVAHDRAGWTSTSSVATFITETAPPEPFVKTSPPNAQTVDTLYPLFCWDSTIDTGSGLSHYDLVVTNGQTGQTQSELRVASSTSSATICRRLQQPLPNGPYNWQVTATDVAGRDRSANAGAAWSMTVDVDVTPPSCSIDLAPNAFLEPPYRLVGSANDPNLGSGVIRVELCIDGQCNDATLGGQDPLITWTFDWPTPTDGTHVVTCRATDRETNVQPTPTSRNFSVDLAPPLPFNLIAPPNNACGLANPTLSWASTTDSVSPIARYETQVWPEATNQANATRLDVGLATSWTIPMALTAGGWNWTAWACDARDNCRQASQVRTLRVDADGPLPFAQATPNPTTQVDGTLWNSTGQVDLCWASTSDLGCGGLGTSPYRVYVNGALRATTSQTCISYAPPSDGTYTWYVEAEDTLGLTTTSTPASFGVDTSGPGIAPTESFRLYANQNPASAVDSGLDVQSGERVRVYSAGTLCFADNARCDQGCAGPEGIDGPPSNYSRWPSWGQYRFGRTMGFVDSDAQPISVGPGGAFTMPDAGRLFLTVNDNDQLNCPSRWRQVTVQGEFGFNLLRPVSGSYTDATDPLFEWTPVTDDGSGVGELMLWIDGAVAVGGLPADALQAQLGAAGPLAEGAHTWRVVAQDRVGNTGGSATWTLNIDRSAPSPFSMTAPADGTTVDINTPTFVWQPAVDAPLPGGVPGAGIGRYELWVDGAYNTSVFADRTASEASSAFADGSYSVEVRAFDVFNRSTATSSRTFTVDTEAPEGFALTAPDNGDTVCLSRATFCWNSTSDAGSGLDRYELIIGGNQIPVATSTDTEVCHTLATPLPSATYTWFVRAHDRAGRMTDSNLHTMTLDADQTPPIVTIDSPEANACLGQSELTFVGTATDAAGSCASGLAAVEVSEDGVTWRPATVDGSGDWTAMVTSTGNTTLRARAIDREGLVTSFAAQPTTTVAVDTTPPQPALQTAPIDAAWSDGAAVFQWQAAVDVGCGLDALALEIDGVAIGLPVSAVEYVLTASQALSQGTHGWRVIATDRVGLQAASPTRALRVDTTPPSAPQIDAGGCGPTALATPTITWTTVDLFGEICGHEVTVDGAAAIMTSGNSYTSIPLADGPHSFVVRAFDCAGHVSPDADACTVEIDRVPPTAPTPIAPPSDAILQTAPTMLRWDPAQDARTGICGYIVRLDGVDQTQTASVALPVQPGLTDGDHEWAVRAIDCAGNEGAPSAPLRFTIDGVPPEIVGLLEPVEGAWLATARPRFLWPVATDVGAGVARVTLSLDANELAVLTATATEFVVSTTAAEGLHCAAVDSEDRAGWITSGLPRCFGVDTIPPNAVTLLQPEQVCVGESQPTFVWSAAVDVGSGVDVVTLLLDGVDVALATTSTATQVASPLSSGDHTWAIRVADRAGNVATSTRALSIDADAPSCALTAVDDAGGGDYTIRGVATDTGCSGLADVQVRIDSGPWLSTDGADVWSFDWIAPQSGTHSVECRARDGVMRSSLGEAAAVTIDGCNVTGPCAGSPLLCSSPATGLACDDGNACSHSDVCLNDGTCGGTSYSCTNPGTCRSATSATCQGDGTCDYPIDVGGACAPGLICVDNGECDATGACLPAALTANWQPCGGADVCYGGDCLSVGEGERCADATAIQIDGSIHMDTLADRLAFRAIEPSCGGTFGLSPDVWFSFDVATAMRVRLSIEPVAGLDVAVAVYQGCAMNQCEGVTDAGAEGDAEVVELDLQPGTYVVHIADVTTSSSTQVDRTFTIVAEEVVPSAMDAGVAIDAGAPEADGGATPDGGPMVSDAATVVDSGGVTSADAAIAIDAGSTAPADAAAALDGGDIIADVPVPTDGDALVPDGGMPTPDGSTADDQPTGDCSCATTSRSGFGPEAPGLVVLLLAWWGRRRRRSTTCGAPRRGAS